MNLILALHCILFFSNFNCIVKITLFGVKPLKNEILQNWTTKPKLYGTTSVKILFVENGFLTHRRVVVRLWTSDVFSLRFFSKPSEPIELQNRELIENS